MTDKEETTEDTCGKSEQEAEAWLYDLLRDADEEVRSVATFEGVGLLTMNRGIVFKFCDGSGEFQLTIVRRN